MAKTKVCTKCGRMRPLSDFTKNKLGKDGLSVWCQDCLYESCGNYCRDRMRDDVIFRLRTHFLAKRSNLIPSSAKRRPIEELWGCSAKELKRYLQRKFKTGMKWDNHTKNTWMIKSKQKPKEFDFRKVIDQKQFFNYKNWQPEWSANASEM